jgi:hypothetical protein
LSKPRVVAQDPKTDRFSRENVKANNAAVRAQANSLVRGMMDEVDAAIDSENANMNARFEGEQKLRDWAAQLCGVALDISEIEDLRDQVKSLRNGGVYSFSPKRRDKNGEKIVLTLYKTAFGVVDRLDRYVYTLEKTIVDLSTTPKAEIPKPQYTDLSFFDLIKLALKRLFSRSK